MKLTGISSALVRGMKAVVRCLLTFWKQDRAANSLERGALTVTLADMYQVFHKADALAHEKYEGDNYGRIQLKQAILKAMFPEYDKF